MSVIRQFLGSCRNGRFSLSFLSIAVFFPVLFPMQRAWAELPATATTLTITSGGQTVSNIAGGQVVTLTATVLSNGTPVTPGQVKFCDATAAYCIDSHLLGTAQLTSTGTATFRFVPGLGSHSYVAKFAGTNKFSSSNSANAGLTVSGQPKTVTDISSSISPENVYSLSATVYGNGKFPPTGPVSFLNTNDDNAMIDTAELYGPTASPVGYSSSVVSTGQSPITLVTADFNLDGIPDIATVNSSDNTVTILLGKGDGTFTAASTVAVGPNPESIVVADFNSDGIPDLAVADAGNPGSPFPPSLPTVGDVAILLGDGKGNFTRTATNPVTGLYPFSLATADVNGDGISDLVVINFAIETVNILAGKGDGTFQSIETLSTGQYPRNLAIGDFNGDGIPDLAFTGGTLQIYFGKGNGTFHLVNTIPSDYSNLTVGDLNGDGKSDLVSWPAEDFPFGSIFLSKGDGTFDGPQGIGFPGEVESIVLADMNNDGILDLAAVGYSYNLSSSIEGELMVALGKGDGQYSMPVATLFPTVNTYSVIAADWNGDGVPDLGTTDYGANTASTFLFAIHTATATAHDISVTTPTPYVAKAVYAGDEYNVGSESSSTVSLGATPKISFSVTPNPGTNAHWQTLTAAVSGGGAMPTGNVVFYEQNNKLFSCQLNVSVIPSCSWGTFFSGGHHVVTAKYLGDNNYAPVTSASVDLLALRSVPTISIKASENPDPYGNQFTLTASMKAPSFGATGTVRFLQGDTEVGSGVLRTFDPFSNTIVSITEPAAGQYSIKAVYSGDLNNAPVTSNALDLVVPKGIQTISFPAPSAHVIYGVTPIQLRATSPSGLPITYSVTGPGTVNGLTLTIQGAGTVAVTARQDGNANYDPAKPVTQTIVVEKAKLKVTAQNKSRPYGAANPAFTYTLSGFVNGDNSSVVSGAPALNTSATATSPAGKYEITVGQGTLAASNYDFAPIFGTLTVTP